ncbi:hypothetical protein U1Q18_042291 [Sarracenia purpurea var. burkii]
MTRFINGFFGVGWSSGRSTGTCCVVGTIISPVSRTAFHSGSISVKVERENQEAASAIIVDYSTAYREPNRES